MVRRSDFGCVPVVVCVDDDPEVLHAVQRLLRREPYEVLTTDKPETALRWLGERRAQLLITDLRMPDMDGTELVKVVEERFPETASLILTGYPEQVPVRPRPRLIRKPWDDSELKDAIRTLVQHPRVPRRVGVIGPPFGMEKGRLLVVAEDPRVRMRAAAAAPNEHYEVHVAIHEDESLLLIREAQAQIEVVILDSAARALPLRRALPDAMFVVLAEDPSSEEIRSWYDLGIEQVLRVAVPVEVLASVFQRSVLRVRACRERAQQRALLDARRAADPWITRARRNVREWIRAPARSRIGERRILGGVVVAAVLIGILLAIMWRAIQKISPLDFAGVGGDPMERFWRASIQDQAMHRWYLMQQLEINRHIQAETERYHDLQLRQPLPAPEKAETLEPRKR
jgi:DNA-binding NarL/FixJ family response regulator